MKNEPELVQKALQTFTKGCADMVIARSQVMKKLNNAKQDAKGDMMRDKLDGAVDKITTAQEHWENITTEERYFISLQTTIYTVQPTPSTLTLTPMLTLILT